jgi:hypothetical protein
MARLNLYAREILRDAGYTPKRWAETTGAISPEGEWVGDACGCNDDRCIGYHHEEDEDCYCLPSLIELYSNHPPEQ